MKHTGPEEGKQFSFSPEHRKYLADRAISEATARLAQWRGVSAEEGAKLLGFKKPLASAGLATKYIDNGEAIAHRIRLDDPGVDEHGKKRAKCLTEKGKAYPYIPPPDVVPTEVWADVSQPVYVVEAPAKALALCDAGIFAIGLGGVSAGGHDAEYSRKTGGLRVHPLLAKNVVLDGRTVVIVFDAGRANNPRVASAEAMNALALLNAGANVLVASLPLREDGADQGPDDFIAANGVASFKEVVDAAVPADPIDRVTQLKRLPSDERADAAYALLDDLPFLAAVYRRGKKFVDRVATRMKANAGINKAITKHAVDEFAESLRAKASGAGAGGKASGKMSQATSLVTLLRPDLDLFHAPDGKAFASFDVDGHRETYAVRSSRFRAYLNRHFWNSQKKTLSREALQEAVGVFESLALFEGDEIAVATRVGAHGGKLYLDLCDERWRVVEIGPEGWSILNASPVRFIRAPGMSPLPEPVRGGSLDELRELFNATDEMWMLIKAWTVGTIRTIGSYAILVMTGEQGSGKTTASMMLRRIVDPNTADLRSPPRTEHDLVIAASHGWTLAFDNLSFVSSSLSDAFCRLSTGGGFATRKLYQDDEEVIFEAKRPMLLNGIDDFATRPDLLDRSIIANLLTIPKERRIPERELWERFEEIRPRALAGLFDAVSCALRRHADVRLDKLPRLADFAIWATAAEPGMGLNDGDFMRAYESNRDNANDLALESSVLTGPIRDLVSTTPWSGTATELLFALSELVDEDVRRRKEWPKKANTLSNKLRRIAPNLRATGLLVGLDHERDDKRRKLISLSQAPDMDGNSSFASRASFADTEVNDPHDLNDEMRHESAPVDTGGDDDDEEYGEVLF